MDRRVVALVLTLFLLLGHAQSAPEPNAKAAKIHGILAKRPSPGYLFERFTNTWLDTNSLAELEAFLRAEIEEDASTANRLLLAFHFSKQRDHVQALDQFRLALESDPGNAEAWFEKATQESRGLNFKQALADLTEASKGNPNEELAIEIAKLRGQLHLRLDQTEEALQAWSQLLQEFPEDESLWEDLIELQVREGLFEEAVKTSEGLISRTSDVYEQVIRELRLGDIHQRAGRREDALQTYGKTLEKAGADTWLEKEILAQIEQTFRRDEDLSGLEAYFTELVETYPQRLAPRIRQAELFADSGDKAKAIKAYEAILKQTPGERKYREAYVNMLEKLGDLEKAIEQQRRLTETYPEDGELFIRLAELNHAAEEAEEAKAALGAYLNLSDKSEYAFLRVARLLDRYELTEAAEATYEALTQAHPNSQAAQEARAAFLHEHERSDEAIALWKSMGEGADRSELVRVARILATREEKQAAFDLLHARLEDFRRDPIFLSELCQLAIQLEKFETGLPWAKELVEKSSNAFELETAIKHYVRMATGADTMLEILEALKTAEARSINESCLLAELLEREGDSRAASEVLAKTKGSTPGEEIILLDQQVRLFRQRQEWKLAAEASEKLIALPGGKKSAYLQKVIELYEKAENWPKALHWVAEWKQLAPGSTQPWLKEARLLELNDEVDKAITVLRRGTQQFEDNESLRSELAALFLEQGKEADAMQLYWRLYEDSEDLADKLSWVKALAGAAQSQNTLEDLVAAFQERRESNRRSVLPLLALAEVHAFSGNDEKQRDVLREASGQRPEDLNLLHKIASIEALQGDTDAAFRTLETAASIDPSNKTQQRIAKLHLDQGDEERGFQLLEKIAGGSTMGPRDAETLASTMLGGSHFERAVTFLKGQAEQHPGDYRLGYLYGIALEENHQIEAALDEFLRLLSIDQEIPSFQPSANTAQLRQRQSYQQRYWKALRAEAPGAAVDLMEQMNFETHQAYSHRQQRQWRGYSTPGQVIAMPMQLDRVAAYVVPHLASIAQDEALEERVHESLRAAGYRMPAITLAHALPNQQGFDFEALLEEEGPNEALEAYWVYRGINYFWSSEVATRVFERFRDSHPQLAIRVGLQPQTLIDEETRPLVDESLALLQTIESPTPSFVLLVAQLLQGQTSTHSDGALTPEQIEPLAGLLERWHGALPERERLQALNTFAVFYRQTGKLGPFLKLIDEEFQRLEDPKAKTSASPMSYFYSRRQSNLELRPLPFPPTLADYPVYLINLICVPPDPSRSRYGYNQNMEPLDPEALAQHYDKVQSPMLRALVASQLEETSHMDQALEALLADTPTIDHLLLAAAHAGMNEDPNKALALLQQAAKLPTNRTTRTKIDAAIVGYALEDEVLEEESPLRLAGKDAALRLRRQATTPQAKSELADALYSFGLEKESEKLTNNSLLAGASYRGRSGGAFYGGSFRSPNHSGRLSQQNQIEALVEQGRESVAVKTSLRQLRGLANSHLNPQNLQTNFYQAREIVGALLANGLADDVLAAADPGEDAQGRRLAQFALICLMFDKHERAQAVLKTSLDQNPKDDAARMHYFLSLSKSDPEKAAAQLGEFPPRLLGPLGNGIQEILGNTERFEDRIPIIESIIEIAKKTDSAPQNNNLWWLVNITDSLAQNIYQDDYRLPSLHAKYPREDSTDESMKETQAAMDKKRRQLHEKLCRALMDIPELAFMAFHRLTARPLYDDPESTAFLAEAKQAYFEFNPNQYNQYHMGYNDEIIPYIDPDLVLLKHGFRSQSLPALSEEIVPALKGNKNKRRNEAQRWHDQVELLTCAEDEFLAKARNFLFSRRVYHGGNSNLIHQAPSRLVELWKIRGLDCSLTELLLEHVKKHKRHGESGRHFLNPYLVHLIDKDRADEATATIEALSDLFLGPVDQRAKHVEENFDPNNWSHRTANGDIHLFQQLMLEIGRAEALAFLASDALEPILRMPGSHQNPPVEQLLNSRKISRADLIEKILQQSSWLGEADTLKLYPRANQGQGTVFSLFFKSLEQNDRNEASKAAALAVIESLEEPTLGSRLALAYLNDEAEPSEIAEILMSAREDILALPPERQADWAHLLKELDVDDIPPEEEELATFLESLHRTQVDDALAEIDRFLSKASKRQQNHRGQATEREAKRLLVNAFKTHPEDVSLLAKAQEVVAAALEMDKRYHMRNGNTSYLSQQPETNLLNNLLTDSETKLSPVLACLALDRLSQTSSNKQQTPQIQPSSLAEAIREQLASLTDNDSLPPLEETHAQLKTWFGDRDLALVSRILIHRLGIFKPKEIDKALEWLSERSDEDALARELEMVLRLRKAEVQDEPAPDPISMAYYTSKLEDARRPLAWRLFLATEVLESSDAVIDDSFRMSAGRLLIDAWKDRYTTVVGDQTKPIIEALTKPHAKTEEWAALGGKIIQQHVRATQSNRGQGRGISNSEIQSLLSLGLECDAEAGLAQLLKSHGQTLMLSPETLATLIKDGKQGLARILVSHHLAPEAFSNGRRNFTYDSDLEAGLPAMLAEIKDEDIRLFVETLFKMQSDASASPPLTSLSPKVTREERLAELLPRLASHSFRQRKLLRQCLQFFAEDYTLSASLVPLIDNALKGLDIASIASITDSSTRREPLMLFAMRIAHRASMGQTEFYLDAIDALEPLKLQRDNQRDEALVQMHEAFKKGATRFWTKADNDANRDAMLPAWRRLTLSSKLARYRNDEWFLYPMIAHADLGKLTEFDESTFKKLDEDGQAALDKRVTSGRATQAIETLIPDTEENFTRRLNVAFDIFNQARFLDEGDDMTALGLAIDRRLFKAEKLLEETDLILEKAKDKKRDALNRLIALAKKNEKAEIQSALEKQLADLPADQ